MRMTAAIIDLVPRIAARRPSHVDDDLVYLCGQLLALAKTGSLTGIAMIGLMPNRTYFVDGGGEARGASRREIHSEMMVELLRNLSAPDERVAPR